MISEERLFKIVDACFSEFASDKRQDARDKVKLLLEKTGYKKGDYCRSIHCNNIFLLLDGDKNQCITCDAYKLHDFIKTNF